MTPVVTPASKAVWFIENHFGRALTLDDVATAAGVSRFHLARVFDARFGVPVMAYVRGRRLAIAARVLAGGAPDILNVALDAGYGSHEAFTRAFVAAFGLTPETVRQQKCLENLNLQEPFAMTSTPTTEPSPHTLKSSAALRLAGLAKHYGFAEAAAIPAQWQLFVPWLSDIPGRAGDGYTTYGVCYNQSEDTFDYLCGVEVVTGADLPREFSVLDIPAATYAIFPHTGHVSGIRNTWMAVWDTWLPQSGLKPVQAPCFEKYGPQFNGMTGEGGLEIWIPVQV